jgi:hypothetical protein
LADLIDLDLPDLLNLLLLVLLLVLLLLDLLDLLEVALVIFEDLDFLLDLLILKSGGGGIFLWIYLMFFYLFFIFATQGVCVDAPFIWASCVAK